MPWQGPGFLVSLLVPISFFAVIGLMAAMLYWRSQAKMRARLEFQTQLLSKFGTGQELATFLSAGGSHRLMEELSAEPANSKLRILKRTRTGAVMTAFGLVFLVATRRLDDGFGVIAVFCWRLASPCSLRRPLRTGSLRKWGCCATKNPSPDARPVTP